MKLSVDKLNEEAKSELGDLVLPEACGCYVNLVGEFGDVKSVMLWNVLGEANRFRDGEFEAHTSVSAESFVEVMFRNGMGELPDVTPDEVPLSLGFRMLVVCVKSRGSLEIDRISVTYPFERRYPSHVRIARLAEDLLQGEYEGRRVAPTSAVRKLISVVRAILRR